MTTQYNSINITIYDIATQLTTGYTKISIYSSATAEGTYTETTLSSTRLTLASGTTFYTYVDSGTSINSNYYKYKLVKATGSASDFITSYFWGNTSDMVENLVYMVDKGCARDFTDKELRRYVKLGIFRLGTTGYRKKFYSDTNGLIYPRMSRVDQGVILLASAIAVIDGKLTPEANRYISFNDGRGRIDVKTHIALTRNHEIWAKELEKSIMSINNDYVSPLLVDMSENTFYADYTTDGDS